MWKLGEHKLVIGDCVDRNEWNRIFGKEKFDFMFTDPPYQIGANIKGKKKEHRHNKTEVEKKEGFGYKGIRKYEGLEGRGGVPDFDEWLLIANEFKNSRGSNVMIFESWKNVVKLWQAIEKYWRIRNIIIWWLPNRCQGFGRRNSFYNKYDIAPLAGEGVLNGEYEGELDNYLQEKGQKLLDSYEIILYGKKDKSYWDKRKKTVWAKMTDHITHPAATGKSSGQSLIFGTKPLPILVPYIKILSPRNGIVIDPFCGSGSTMIACEIMKRRCRAIEIEPIYGEVVLMRWEKFTGKKAVKIDK